MLPEIDIPIESYFRYPSQYDKDKPSVIEGYEHPKLLPPDYRPSFYRTMKPGVVIEIEELVLQVRANWPQVDLTALISDRANVHPDDVSRTFRSLLRNDVFSILEPGFEYTYDNLTSSAA